MKMWAEIMDKPNVGLKPYEHKETDVLIVGGGIAGLLIAYRLKEAGVKCAVVEAKKICGGVTRNTTAKITAQHGLIYSKILKRYGIEKARQYFEANSHAVDEFRSLAEKFPCDFETKNAFVYSTDNRAVLEREAEAYLKIGIPSAAFKSEDDLPLPISTQGAIVMENQAQYNPLKFLYALANELEIYENTFINKIDETQIRAKHIVLATHYPMINIRGLYFIKLYQHRSYVIALENAAQIHGMFLDEKKEGMSFRNYKNLLFVGGGDHKTGKTGGGYAELRNFAKTAYPVATEKSRWVTQDCMSLDGIPYIGKISAKKRNVFVATGFNKWGMTGSMVAARVIRDIIVGGKSEYESLYSPQRSIFTKQLPVNIASAAAGLLSIGAPRCSHMGCKLKWNKIEKTWDCSCHGSRFNAHGHVIDNPAKKGIRV
ncbi:MAG: FAD-dependent oxidoreductase [Clostridiales bacterium]|nr:FAD-dependent oxidoreductase [Clostridiales bacterium]